MHLLNNQKKQLLLLYIKSNHLKLDPQITTLLEQEYLEQPAEDKQKPTDLAQLKRYRRSDSSDERSGKLYELALMMFILTKNHKIGIDFDLGREIKIGDKFDDIVIRSNNNDRKKYIFLQAKLVDNNNDLINSGVLHGKEKISLNEKDFFLQKYFISYLRIDDQLKSRNDKSNLEKVIIFTNAGLDNKELKENVIRIQSSIQGNPLPSTNKDAKSYKINMQKGRQNSFIQKLELNNLKSDLEKIAEELAEYTTNPGRDTMTLKQDHFDYYHMALIDEKVITVEAKQHGNKVNKKGKFTENFIKKELLSPRAEELRSKMKKKVSIKNQEGIINERELQKYMANAEFKVSNDFGIEKSPDRIFLPSYEITDNSIKDFFHILELRVNELNLKDLSYDIRNEEIKEVFLEYYDTDPRFIEFIIKDSLENWKEVEGSEKERWILNTERSKFIQELKTNIAKPKVKHKSEEYVTKLKKIIEKFDLQFDDDFFTYDLQQEEKKFLVVKTDSTLLSSIKMIECLKKNNRDNYIFINLESLRDKQEMAKLVNTFKALDFKLLVLSYDSRDDLGYQLQQEFLTALNEMMKSNKKIIFITSIIDDSLITKLKNKYKNQYKEIRDRAINLKDLKNPSMILEQSIILQDQSITLNKLIDEGNEDSKKIIDSEIIVKLVSNKKIKIGSKPLGTSDLEGSYAELLQEMNKEVLGDNLSSKKSDHAFVISGINGSDKKGFLTQALKTSNIDQDQIGEFIVDTMNIKRITLTDENFTEPFFKKLCHSNPNKKIYWINLINEGNESKFKLRQLYNPEFYLNRQFKKIIIHNDIKEELTKDNPNSSFLFTGVDNLKSLLEILQFREKEKNIKNKKVTIQKANGQATFDELTFNEKKTENKPIHWLHIEDNNGNKQIIWRKSHGSLENLRKYIDKAKKEDSLVEESGLIEAIHGQKIVIIADEPGMGKSTSLTKLYESKNKSGTGSKSMLESHWVIRVNLKDHLPALRNINSNNVINICNFLSEVDSNLSSTLAQNLLKAALKSKTIAKPLLIAFDGFDEVLDEDVRDKIILLLKFLKDNTEAKFWITSRLHYEQTLENALSTFATEFEPINNEKKREFINKYLKNCLSLTLSKDNQETKIPRYAESFLKKMQSVFVGDNSKFIGTPLQLYLMLEGSVSHFTDWLEKDDAFDPDFSYLGSNIDEVYEKFINRKYDIYFRKEGVTEKLKQEQDKVIFDRYNKELAKSLILKSKPQKNLGKFKDIVLSSGIIKSQGIGKDLEFIHPTFKEYFAAQLFTHWIQKESSELSSANKKEHLLTKILMLPDYKLIRTFMNLKLEKTKIPEESLEQFGEVIYKLWQEKPSFLIDNEAQTILHIAAKESNIEIINFLFKILKKKYSNFDTLKALVQATNLGKKTVLQEAVQQNNEESLKCLLQNIKDSSEILLKKQYTLNSDTSIDSILNYAADKNYLNILKILLEYAVDINTIKNKMGSTILHSFIISRAYVRFSSIGKQKEIIKLLIDKGVPVDEGDKMGLTALHYAAYFNNPEGVKTLLNVKATGCPNVGSSGVDLGLTPLQCAVLSGNKKIVELILNEDENMKKRIDSDSGFFSEFGITSFHIAAILPKSVTDRDEIIKLLFKAVEPQQLTNIINQKVTAKSKSVKILIKKIIQVSEDVSVDSETGSHMWLPKSFKGFLQSFVTRITSTIVSHVIDFTAYDIAQGLGEKDTCTLLTQKGASITKPAKLGKFLLRLLKDYLIPEIKSNVWDRNPTNTLLQEWQEDIFRTIDELDTTKKKLEKLSTDDIKELLMAFDDRGETLLHVIAKKGFDKIIMVPQLQDCIKKYPEILFNPDNKHTGATALHTAVRAGYYEVVRQFLALEESIKDDFKTYQEFIIKSEKNKKVAYEILNETIELRDDSDVDTNEKEIEKKIMQLLQTEKLETVDGRTESDFLKLLTSSASGSSCSIDEPKSHYSTHLRKKRAIWSCTEQEESGKQKVVKTGKWHEVVQWLIEEKGADVDAEDEFGRTILHKAAEKGNLQAVQFLLAHGANLANADKYGTSILHFAAASGNRDFVKWLVEVKHAAIDTQDIFGKSVLHFASLYGYQDIVALLEAKGASIDLRDNYGETALDFARKEEHQEIVKQLHQASVERNNRQYLEILVDNLTDLQGAQKKVGLESLGGSSGSASCKAQYRTKRNIASCGYAESDHFSYAPLEETMPVAQIRSSKLYTQISMAVALRYAALFGNGNIQATLDHILSYNKYVGDIISEGARNHSPREQQILAEHYAEGQQFFINYPEKNLLSRMESNRVAEDAHKSWFFDNGQQTMLMFRDGQRYQLYSQDFNYQQRFQTKKDLTFTEVEELIAAFFKWRSSSSRYQTFTLSDTLPTRLIEGLKLAKFWQAEQVVPDSILLSKKHFDLIESLPATAIKELFLLHGQSPDIKGLHPDFFQQHQDYVSLRVEVLHKVLPSLNAQQIQELMVILKKYNIAIDRTYVNKLSKDEKSSLELYYNKVTNELKMAQIISVKSLSKLSWKSLSEVLANHPQISPELANKVVSSTQEIHATASKKAVLKGMATQTLFFLPDIIRAANSGDISNLEQTGAMIAGDTAINHLYGGLVNKLETVLPAGRAKLLGSLPVTSPIFKALTIYSIVELTKQLQTLPPHSAESSIIKHKLGEQYVTAGLMVAELLGFEMTPLWIALIAEQLIFDAESLRKQNHLDIPFWEALLMSLGFEQDKLQNIFAERQLFDVNLAMVNNFNSQAQVPYGWVIVKIPKLGQLTWQTMRQDQVPNYIKDKILAQQEDFVAKVYSPDQQILETDGFRQVANYQTTLNYFAMDSDITEYRGKLNNSQWQRASYAAYPGEAKIKFALYQNHHKSSAEKDNFFLDQALGNNSNWQRIPSKYEGIKSTAGAMLMTKAIERRMSELDPVAKDNLGLAAVYVNNQTDASVTATASFYVGFDPREGDIEIEFTVPGLQRLDELNKQKTVAASSEAMDKAFNGNSAYVVTVQVGYKPYPESIQFSKKTGTFVLKDDSQRIISQYMINDTMTYVIKDSTVATRINFANSSSQQPKVTCKTIIAEQNTISILSWKCNKKIVNGREQIEYWKRLETLGKILLPNDQKYLQLVFTNQVIDTHLRVSAEHVEIMEAKGQLSRGSKIDILPTVKSFNIALRGDILVNDGPTYLHLTGIVPNELSVMYSKTKHNGVISFYELKIADLLPVLETIVRSNPMLNGVDQDYNFSSGGLEYHWRNKLPTNNMIKIEGALKGKTALLQIEQNSDTLKIFNDDNSISNIEIVHYDQEGIFADDLILTQVFIRTEELNPSSTNTPSNYQLVTSTDKRSNLIKLDIISNNKKGDVILVFQANSGYAVYHYFPASSKIKLNNIDYAVTSQNICAVNGPNNIIDGDKLIRYNTASTLKDSPKMIGVCVSKSLTESKIFLKNETLIINDVALQHLSDSTKLYFAEHKILPLKALKDSITNLTVGNVNEKKVELSYEINKQLELLAEVVNGLKYLLITSNKVNNASNQHCFGFKTAAEYRDFDNSYANHGPESLQKLLHHNQIVPALIWSIAKDYNDLALQTNKTPELLLTDISQCYQAVVSEKITNRLVKQFEEEDTVAKVQRFIQQHQKGLEQKIVAKLKEHQRSRREINDAGEGIAEEISDDNVMVSSAATSLSSPGYNIFYWLKEKSQRVLKNLLNPILPPKQQNKSSGQKNGLYTSENIDTTPKIEETKNRSKAHNVSNFTQFDLNNNLTLVDLIVRKFTKAKHYATKEEPCNLLAIQGQVLNIMAGFEKILEEASEEHNIPMSELEIDPVTLTNKLKGELTNGKFVNIDTILFASISNTSTTFDQSEFGNYLQDRIAEMLEEQQANLLLNQQLVNKDAASWSDLYTMAEFYNADIIGYCPTAQIDHQQNKLIGCGE